MAIPGRCMGMVFALECRSAAGPSTHKPLHAIEKISGRPGLISWIGARPARHVEQTQERIHPKASGPLPQSQMRAKSWVQSGWLFKGELKQITRQMSSMGESGGRNQERQNAGQNLNTRWGRFISGRLYRCRRGRDCLGLRCNRALPAFNGGQ